MQACKPGSVLRWEPLSFIWSRPSRDQSVYPPRSRFLGKNGPFIFIGAYLTFQHIRFTMHPSLLLGRWALTPPFHYDLNLNESVRGYLFSVVLSVNPPFPRESPCFHKVRCPMLPGLSSPRQGREVIRRLAWCKNNERKGMLSRWLSGLVNIFTCKFHFIAVSQVGNLLYHTFYIVFRGAFYRESCFNL